MCSRVYVSLCVNIWHTGNTVHTVIRSRPQQATAGKKGRVNWKKCRPRTKQLTEHTYNVYIHWICTETIRAASMWSYTIINRRKSVSDAILMEMVRNILSLVTDICWESMLRQFEWINLVLMYLANVRGKFPMLVIIGMERCDLDVKTHKLER